MKYLFTKCLIVFLLSCNMVALGQPAWRWAKSGGSIADNGSAKIEDVIDMATDKKGNLYVLAKVYGPAIVDGQTGSSNTFDRLVVASWSCNGSFRWKKIYGSGSLSTGASLRTDTLGGVYVTGAMYSSYGAIGGPGYFDTDSVLAFNNKSMFLLKYDTAGILQWLKMPEPDTVSPGNPLSGVHDMDVAPNGDIYLYCQLKPAAYDNGAFAVTARKLYVLKYNAAGVFQSVTPLSITATGGSTGNGFPNASSAHFKRDHKNGRYYICGRYEPTFGNLTCGTTNITKPLFLASFSSSGTCLWTRQSNGNTMGWGWISDRVATDTDENIYMGGIGYNGDGWNGYIFDNDSFTTLLNSCPFVVKMDRDGNNIWATHAQSSGGNNYAGITLVNNVVACTGPYVKISWDGFYVSQSDVGSPRYDNFLARINANTGAVIGLDSLKSSFGFEEVTTAIAADRNGNIFVGGNLQYDLFTEADTPMSVGGARDWFVAKSGSTQCNCTVPSVSFNAAVTAGNTFSFTYTGNTPVDSIVWDFGDGSHGGGSAITHNYAAAGVYTVCATAYNNCGSNISCKEADTDDATGIGQMPGFAGIRIYPNPAEHTVCIEQAMPGTHVRLFNTVGQQLLQTSLTGGRDVIDIRSLAPGTYLVHLITKEGKQGTSRFVKQ